MRTPEERKATWLKKRLNTLIAQAGYADDQLRQLQLQIDEEVRAVTAKYAARIDTHTKRREAAVDKIQEIVSDDDNWKLIAENDKIKTLTFRSGVIKRRATSKIDVFDAAAALKWLRRRAILRKFTTQPEPAISKSKLAKDPNILEKIPGVQKLAGENMTVKPVKTQIEIERDLKPLRRTIGTD